jgi:hypothetical protein
VENLACSGLMEVAHPVSAGFLAGRSNASFDAGDPSRVVFCLDGLSEQGIRQRLRTHAARARVARQGAQRQRRHHAKTGRGFSEPASFYSASASAPAWRGKAIIWP